MSKQESNPLRPIYLDYNGTTPHAPEVIEAMRPFLESEFGNPASSHAYGTHPREALERAREQVAGLIGCNPEEIIFTSGGTEANNQALWTVAEKLNGHGDHIITSQIEHPAVSNVCRALERLGYHVSWVPVGSDGLVRVEDILSAIRPSTILISIMHSNNEVGTLQPVAEIAHQLKGKGIFLHTDAAQSPGKVPVNVQELGVDMLSVAGHKLYGPKGVGALYVRNGTPVGKLCYGAGQERGLRPGTENVMHIVGLGKACEVASENLSINSQHLLRMRDRLESGLRAKIDALRFNGHRDKRLPNTASVSFYGLNASTLLKVIGEDVAASAGAACHSGSVEISHVLEAMEVPREWARGTVRFSTGRMTTEQEIDRTIDVVSEAVQKLRKGASERMW